MKALIYEEHGADVLRFRDVPDPSPDSHDVIIQVAATTVNHLDVTQRNGWFTMPGFTLPHISGMDVAGTVVEMGSKVKAGEKGERVIVDTSLTNVPHDSQLSGRGDLYGELGVSGANADGGYAELCVVPETHVYKIPEHMSWHQAAMFPTVWMTAHHALFDVAQLKAGHTPDARYGQIAKQRSTHNNYLTLPVIFFMLSNHYPLAYSTDYSWVIAALVFLMGVSIRHYFNSRHARQGNPIWTWAITAGLFVAIIILSLLPAFMDKSEAEKTASTTQKLTTEQITLASADEFEEVRDIVLGRCSMCHASEPYYERILWPPKGVMLETDQQIITQAKSIIMQSALSHAMPPANVSYMEPEERRILLRWFKASLSSQANQ